MLAQKPIMGWNSWNTFGKNINEKLIMEVADAMVEKGYRDAGYDYIIIDDCWSLKERVDGKLVADPALFPNGMKHLSDYIHSKGMKFGMYSCSGPYTCAGYPSSYGHEYEDAKQFAEWGVDYLKYDFCHFPRTADPVQAYLTMSQALRSSGREIIFAACNWGWNDSELWMREIGAHTYRSTGDIFDTPQSFVDIFHSQLDKVRGNASGCHNDMDMLIVGMHGNGNVGLGGCTSEEYFLHFAMWAYMGSPLIIGGDIRNMSKEDEATLLNKGLIAINQDEECRPPHVIHTGGSDAEHKHTIMMKILSGRKFSFAIFNIDSHKMGNRIAVTFDDMGISPGIPLKITNAITGEDMGIHRDAFIETYPNMTCGIYIAEVVNE